MWGVCSMNHKMQLLFHVLGLSSLAGSVFLQILVFKDILHHGYFVAVENNPIILLGEIVLSVYTVVYFIYIYQRFIRSVRTEGVKT